MENEYISINIRENKQKDLFILTISGIGHEHQASSYVLLENSFDDINLCGLTCKKRDFFINDLTNDTINYIKSISEQFSKKILITHSMGGYFGLFLDKHIKFDMYFICSPYLSLDKIELKLNDDEFNYLSERLLNNNIEKYCVDMIKFNYLSLNNPEKFIIVLDSENNEDLKQFNLLENHFPKSNIVLLPNSGHISLYILEKEKILSKFIKENIEKNIDSDYIINLINTVLIWYLDKVQNKEKKNQVLNQLFYNNINKDIDYFDFVLSIKNNNERDYFFILDKYGRILSLSNSRKRYSYIRNPFNTKNYVPVFFKRDAPGCTDYSEPFVFYDGSYISVTSHGLYEKINENYIHVYINKEILTEIYYNIDFGSKISILSIVEYNRKTVKKSRKNLFQYFFGVFREK